MRRPPAQIARAPVGRRRRPRGPAPARDSSRTRGRAPRPRPRRTGNCAAALRHPRAPARSRSRRVRPARPRAAPPPASAGGRGRGALRLALPDRASFPTAGRGALRGERAGQQPPGEVVATSGESDFELPRGAPVQLGRTARARALPAAQAAVGCVQQPEFDQLVQVESSEGARDAEGARCLIASHLAPAPGDVEIKLPPDGLVERRDGRDAGLEIGRAHATNLHLSVRGESRIARRLAHAGPLAASFSAAGQPRRVLEPRDSNDFQRLSHCGKNVQQVDKVMKRGLETQCHRRLVDNLSCGVAYHRDAEYLV